MIALAAALVLVPLVDQGVKWMLARTLGTRAVSLGPFGHVKVICARVWIARLGAGSSIRMLWGVWLLAVGLLLLVTWWIPASLLFVGLLLGGSLSHGLEHSLRGSVIDYVCLRFWPAFNLADVAITAGTIGIVAHLSVAFQNALG